MEVNRRARTRVPFHFEVIVSTDGHEIPVESLNISLKGLLCTADSRFSTDEPCIVTLNLAEDIVVTIHGTIVRADEEKTAIDFRAMDEESFFHLKKIVEYNAGDTEMIESEVTKPAFFKDL